MKSILLSTLIMSFLINHAQAADAEANSSAATTSPTVANSPAQEGSKSDVESHQGKSIENGDFCLFSGLPNTEIAYTKIREIKASKGSYGGVKDILPVLVKDAIALGGNAIINYDGAQRFGFWPWRLTHPVVHGTAIKWNNTDPIDCAALGGKTLATVITTNIAPGKDK